MAMRQFAVFVGVGITCAAIDIGLMQLLTWGGLHYIAATTLGFAAGLVVNFLLHTRITFNTGYSHGTLVRFMVVVLINYLLTLLTVSLFHASLDMALLGKVVSLPLVAVNGFLLSKYWVYR